MYDSLASALEDEVLDRSLLKISCSKLGEVTVRAKRCDLLTLALENGDLDQSLLEVSYSRVDDVEPIRAKIRDSPTSALEVKPHWKVYTNLRIRSNKR